VEELLVGASAFVARCTGLHLGPWNLALLVSGSMLFVTLVIWTWRRRTCDARVHARLVGLAAAGSWVDVVAVAGPYENRIPPQPLILELLGQAYLHLGNTSRTQRIFRRVLRGGLVGVPAAVGKRMRDVLAEVDERRTYEAGLLALRGERWDSAVQTLQKVQRRSSFPKLPVYLTMGLVNVGQPDLARRQLEQVALDELEPADLYALAGAFEARGCLTDARDLYQRLALRALDYEDVAARLDAVEARLAEADGRTSAVPTADDGPAPTDILQLVAGQLPQRYQIKGKLGMGGMGLVCLAHDRELGVDVAIKVLSPLMAEQQELRARFTSEARALTRLEHPNVIRIFDVGGDSLPYYVMEYLEGRSVRVMIDEFFLPVRDALFIALQVCSALNHAHARQVIHRDVKPENIIVGTGGAVKLVDFGLAKFLDTTAVTRSDVVIGTQLYMAPEQLRHGRVDKATDVYAFGATLFHMVTGVPPFVDSPMYQHIHSEPPDPTKLNADVGPTLRAIILKCLAKDPDDRFANCALLENDLKVAIREAAKTLGQRPSVLLSPQR